ncbi:hypothetical protein ACFVZH_40205, partial [Streptomyces sp. NPDC059534]|uniref:hypothetical protein n=1 Tax=Streptomyces sp. NPDC059534 TaxID=3346859 RepID=UPI00369C94E8
MKLGIVKRIAAAVSLAVGAGLISVGSAGTVQAAGCEPVNQNTCRYYYSNPQLDPNRTVIHTLSCPGAYPYVSLASVRRKDFGNSPVDMTNFKTMTDGSVRLELWVSNSSSTQRLFYDLYWNCSKARLDPELIPLQILSRHKLPPLEIWDYGLD